MKGMGVSFREKGNILFIRLSGELDHHQAEEIRRRTDRRIEEKDILDLVFDCEEVRFMDSSGIGFVMGRYRKVKEKGGRAVILGTSSYADAIFEMAGIYQIIKKCGDEKQARAYCRQER